MYRYTASDLPPIPNSPAPGSPTPGSPAPAAGGAGSVLKRHPAGAASLPGMPQYLVIGLAVVAVGASLPLIPHGRDLALLRFEAGQSDSAIELLERRLADGDRSPATLGTLARIHASRGDADSAIRLMRTLVNDRPRDLVALQALADYARDGARTTDYLDVLERLQALTPTAERQREIAQLYGDLGQEAKQRAALQGLVDRFEVTRAADHLALASLLSAAGDPQAAAQALERLAMRHPAAVDAEVIGMQVAALLAAGSADYALARAQAWLRAQPVQAAQTTLMLAGLFGADGRRDLARSLLEAHATAEVDPQVVAALAQIESDAGQPADALRRIERAEAAGVASDALSALHLDLALLTGRLDGAMTVTERIGFEQVPPDRLERLSIAALAADRKDLLHRVAQRADGTFLSAEPMLAARIHLALGDRAAARRSIDLAARSTDGGAARLVELADLELQLGRRGRALRSLRRAAAQPDAASAPLGQMARLYIRVRHPREGHAALAAIRRRQPSLAADEGWALTAAASRQDKPLRRWLAAGGGRDLPVGFHVDLFHLATDAKTHALAVEVAQRLVAMRGTDRDRLLLAHALVASNRAPEALPHLRALSRQGLVEEQTYAAVLLAAWRQGEPVADELRALWSKRLAAASTPAQRATAVSTLFELGADAQLLPALAALTVENPERWLGLYTDAAARSGHRTELVAMWKTLGDSAQTPAKLRLQIAFRLLGATERAPAEQILRDLAADAPRDDPAVRHLLFVWGPRPTPQQLDWIEARARRASGADKVRWMRDLTERNGAARAVAVYRASGDAAGDAALDAYLDALAAAGDKAGLAAALRVPLSQDRSSMQPRRLVELASYAGDPSLERQALQQAAAAGAADARTLRALGMSAYGSKDFATAERSLAAFVAATGGDYESQMLLGEMRLKQHDAAGARGRFEQAVATIEASGDTSPRARAAQARLLQQLGRDAQARQLYEALLAERPHDKNLRADYVSLLMRTGDLRQARAALDQP